MRSRSDALPENIPAGLRLQWQDLRQRLRTHGGPRRQAARWPLSVGGRARRFSSRRSRRSC